MVFQQKSLKTYRNEHQNKNHSFSFNEPFCIQLLACTQESETQAIKNQNETENIDTMKLKITIGTSSFSATLQNNATANAFKERLPLTLTMTELNNNEKYADLVESLPTNAFNPGTIQNGDLMLYGSNTLVLFIKHFQLHTTILKSEKQTIRKDCWRYWVRETLL